MTTIGFLRAARADALEAREWYDRQAAGLGRDFVSALDTTLARIAASPKHFAEIRPGIRKANLARFPYSVFFESRPGHILVVAVFHAKRDPLVWRRRAAS